MKLKIILRRPLYWSRGWNCTRFMILWAKNCLALRLFLIDVYKRQTTGGSFFRMLTEDLRLNTRLLDTFLPLIKAHYLDFIDRFEVDPAEALQPVCAPFIQPGDYSW